MLQGMMKLQTSLGPGQPIHIVFLLNDKYLKIIQLSCSPIIIQLSYHFFQGSVISLRDSEHNYFVSSSI